MSITYVARVSARRTPMIAVAVVLGSWLAVAAPVQADNIDEGLIRQAPKIVKYLRDSGYENVGVLAFRVKKPHEGTTFQAGLINNNMADRLENSLVLALNPEVKPMGIIKNATDVARKSVENATYVRTADRQQLFGVDYPLAWGADKRVKSDVFLTGRVALSPDLKQTTVTIEAFDKSKPGKISRLLDFTVKTDRYILADLGQGFSLSRSLAKGKGQFRRGSAADDDDLIIFEEMEELNLNPDPTKTDTAKTESTAKKDDEKPSDTAKKDTEGKTTEVAKKDDAITFEELETLDLDKGKDSATTSDPTAKAPDKPATTEVQDKPKAADAPAKPTTAVQPPKRPASSAGYDFPVELKIYYNGKEQPLQPDTVSGLDNWRIDDPKEGQKVTFGLRNKTTETLGVVLSVNGVSTLYEEKGQPNQITKWVLEPNKEYLVKGYHEDKEKFTVIEGLSEELSKETFAKFGEDAGKIHLYVFRPKLTSLASAPAFSRSMRGVSSKVLAKERPKTAFELQAIIARSANTKGGRGLMAWGLDAGKEQLTEMPLGDVGLTDNMVITYFTMK